jgi:sulfur carrier protein ThiS
MKVKISFSKLTKISACENNSEIEVPDKCTVRDFLDFLKVPKIRQRALLVFINNEPTWNSTVIKENDSIKIFPIIGGG